ncbi:MAG: AsnC family transcriptional regulator [Syntrophomonas sp.]|uniref:siroheme decarboxylase subunit alpha n=1 Tax=Syntrophomonas sp. TaxID=2053627 RepID=UPI00262FE9CD|nr:AsnC family transcriptional regulator [Syntrophomonas sp.]MDD2510419.1 AsnC family transcriptional regulator [Syntrophomonas sp.]MDD3878470.1 AsnC family transcriptional regulator [Syntrophomonas sp.]MDD4625880.1 AsnC family transcriptional regulator [Syntrophomonas sp.]
MKEMNELSRTDREILNVLQADFPLTSQPYRDIAEKMNLDEEEVIARIRVMKNSGLIRRIGGIMDARSLGFYSTLCACKVPEERIDAVAGIINRQKGVTHNYIRDHEFNLWFTLTAPTKDEAMQILQSLQSDAGIEVISMPAKQVYKIKVSFEMSDPDAL